MSTYSPILSLIYTIIYTNMTKKASGLRQQQLFQAISEYLQNTGLIQNALANGKSSSVRKLELRRDAVLKQRRLELTVRSLNLQRVP